VKIVDVPKLLEYLGARNVRGEGLEIWASCPIGTHRDSDPSFRIHNEPGAENHGHWQCFGCSEHGGLVGLVKQARGVEGKEARKILDALGTSFEDAPKQEGALAVDVMLLPIGVRPFALPAGIVWEPLSAWPGPIRDYARSRGITAAQVERWRIGYVVSGTLGMRILFPAEDEEGRPGSYSARSVIGDRRKYLTPSKGENPDFGAIFGRRHWPPPGARRACVVVEGAIDGLAVERATGLPFGALGGSNDEPAQWIHLATFERLILLSDSDKAGDRVAEAYALAGGPEVVRARLPEGVDAQTADPELLRKMITRAKDSAYTAR
jgi:DNA primase